MMGKDDSRINSNIKRADISKILMIIKEITIKKIQESYIFERMQLRNQVATF